MRACKNCKFVVITSKECPLCGGRELTEHFSGIVVILDTNSEVAKLLNITKPGAYALRIKKH